MKLNEITEILCGDGVNELEAGLCKNMANLKTVTVVNDEIAEIPEECFSGCARLEYVNF